MKELFVTIAIISLVIYVVSSMMIISYLRDKGVKINFIWLRLLIIKYLDQYRKMTKEETGEVGKLFYVWIISINTALVSVLIAMLVF